MEDCQLQDYTHVEAMLRKEIRIILQLINSHSFSRDSWLLVAASASVINATISLNKSDHLRRHDGGEGYLHAGGQCVFGGSPKEVLTYILGVIIAMLSFQLYDLNSIRFKLHDYDQTQEAKWALESCIYGFMSTCPEPFRLGDTKPIALNVDSQGSFRLSEEAVRYMADRGSELACADLAAGTDRFTFGLGDNDFYNREDPLLIEAIQRLGDRAASALTYCKLAIVEVPKHLAHYDIEVQGEQDLAERVVEEHQTWE